MKQLIYNRSETVAYARKWALGRNPAYFDFQGIGGDCTNFASQCIFAGSGVMNYTSDIGWYYRSPTDRAAAWTGVEYLYRFLTTNRSVGPYGAVVSESSVAVGDVVQLGTQEGMFYHTLVVLSTAPMITVAAHSGDALNRPLDTYDYYRLRCIHIEGVRDWE